ncbi:RNA polymerase sigma-70 factor [Pedobacter sp. MC2016-05]|uniref:RNA polymerase sigma factor n=1 Tax=Pedobacter sp. MC2016-05 TaxID=2994474 RepID=UPI00224532D7|nr:RNA polymerase sigma-70 factor [Pedobacter sp. MC2016-05]MCX2473444.1 RNA polymerase sigma-70 factor [Pedobacter sp. MC2016-05]
MHVVKATEEELLIALKQGNEEAFSAIYKLYVKKIYAFTLNILKSPVVAEDVVQEVFVKLWKSAPTLEDDTSLNAFLYTIARNLALNVIRKAGREQWLTDEIASHAYDTCEDGLAYTQRKQTKEFLDHAISALPPQRKRIYQLCHIEGFSYKQAAGKLGISDSTINSQMVKAIKSIKTYLLRNGALLLLLVFKS